jgi:hypothetical protein
MYTLMVHEGQDQSESGAFFRGRPFEVVVGERSVLCVFRKGTAGKVVYASWYIPIMPLIFCRKSCLVLGRMRLSLRLFMRP